jgi:hypothetical protein
MLAPLLIPLVLAGCGGGGSSSGGAVKTPEVLLAKIPGCTNIKPDTGPQLFDRESATCDFGGTAEDPSSLSAYTFNSQGNLNQWVKIARNFGGVYVVGDSWAVSADTSGDAQKVQSVLGGKIE